MSKKVKRLQLSRWLFNKNNFLREKTNEARLTTIEKNDESEKEIRMFHN